MKVALGAAKGLAFLHSPVAKVIYRDFKASNILLDAVCVTSINLTIYSSKNCAVHLHILLIYVLTEL